MLEKLKNSWFFIAIGVGLFIFIFVLPKFEGNTDFSTVSELEELTPDEIPPIETSSIFVDVKGQVHSPGVYEIDPDFRVNDVIALAGGFTEEADQSHVNLAQKVQDEMTINVPKIGEGVSAGQNGSTKVKINYATESEIETLNGIGPSKAKAIIQYREENGHFKTIEDLLNVSGIGEKTLDNIRDDIQIP